jgi:hypothetical protein
MKSAIAVILLALCVTSSNAQLGLLCDFLTRDSLVVEIAGDTVHVWDLAACFYCARAPLVVSVSVSADSVYVVQTDTTNAITTCQCLLDLKASIIGLPPGTYWAIVQRQYLKQYGYVVDTLLFIKSVQFQKYPPASQSLSSNSWESGCLPNSVPESPANPSKFTLFPNYPNPFNPETTIRFETTESQFVVIKIFDILGREVQTLSAEFTLPGEHRLVFRADAGLSSGVYYCRLTAGSFSQARTMVLLR